MYEEIVVMKYVLGAHSQEIRYKKLSSAFLVVTENLEGKNKLVESHLLGNNKINKIFNHLKQRLFVQHA